MYKPETLQLFKDHVVELPARGSKIEELIKEAEGYDWCRCLTLPQAVWDAFIAHGYITPTPVGMPKHFEFNLYVSSLVLMANFSVVKDRQWVVLMGFDSKDERPNINKFWKQLQDSYGYSDRTLLDCIIQKGLGFDNQGILDVASMFIYG